MHSLVTEARALLEGWKPMKKEGPFGVATEYEMEYRGSPAKLYKKKVKRSMKWFLKRSMKWFLDYKGKSYSLPARATFDHAERILTKAK